MNSKIHILLVDEDFHWTEDLHRVFALEPSLKLIGTSDTMSDGLQKMEMMKPDLIIVNMELPDGDGASFIQQAKKTNPNLIFVAEINNNDPVLYQQAQRAGAHSVLSKSSVTTGEIIQIVRKVFEEARGQRISQQTSKVQTPQINPDQPQPIPQPYQQGNMLGGMPMNQERPQGFPQQPFFTPQGGGFQQGYQGGQPNGYPYQPSPFPPQQGYGQASQGLGQNPYQGFPQGASTSGEPPYPTQSFPQHQGMAPFSPANQKQPQVTTSAARIRTSVIAINSPKGGVGKSSFSKELACAFALAKIPTAPGLPPERLKVCLVDMDLDYGNIASMLRLNPIPNISSWADDINDKLRKGGEKQKLLYAPDQFMPYLLTHAETGLKVLAAPVLPTQALDITERVVEIIIDSLKNYFDIVILDTGNNTRDYTLVAIEKSQKTIVVSTAEVPTVRNVQALLETLEAIHFPMDKLYLALNDVSKRNDLSVNDIVRTLDMTLLGVIPEDPRVRQANNNGEALVMGKDTEYTNAIRKIGHQLVPVFATKRKMQTKKKANLFGFLMKK
ncbi:P-loop NTPase [Neobacillus sp. YIM B02564]|uniref:P-loop NTPase n=1 Tax=Neobacillus paridis TaxID=2803862 RepID=A0ABS1TLS6_9BACI|nr:P-loop NTPase [Neobacillus paridis]MBL4952128.1 P-loop NTPase [Neobacillus paridis]